MWQYQNTDELYHHGVLGQRWGIRRYQNPDGTLTPAGRRKAGRLAAKYAKVTGKKLIVKKKSVQGNQQKSIKEMSDQEILSRINRISLENRYMDLLKTRVNVKGQVIYNPSGKQIYTERQMSRGKKFIKTIKNDVIKPALVDSGRALLTNFIKKKGNDLIYENNKKDPKKAYKDMIADIELKARKRKAENSLNYENYAYDYYKKNGVPYNKKKK